MIKVNRLHNSTRSYIRRYNRELGKKVYVKDIDDALNEAIDLIFENYAAKFENNKTIRNHLRQLERKSITLPVTSKAKDHVFVEYPEDLYMLTRQTCWASLGEFTDRLTVRKVQSDDLSESLVDPNWKPSFEWRETICDEAGNGLYVYHNGEFEIDSIEVDYLKKPDHVAAPSLVQPDNYYIDETGTKVKEDCDFEIDSTFIWRKVANVAALIILRNLGEIQDYQTQLNKMISLENIYIS